MSTQSNGQPRFRDRRYNRLLDLIPPFESRPSSHHVRGAMAVIERLRDQGRQFWPTDSDELARWREGCTELWVFLNTLGQRRDIDQQPLATAFREFVQAFEHTVYRIEQMLHGVRGQDECDPPEVDAVLRWIELAYRLSTYGLVSFWIADKTEEKIMCLSINLTTGERPEETGVANEMSIPRKYRASARLGQHK